MKDETAKLRKEIEDLMAEVGKIDPPLLRRVFLLNSWVMHELSVWKESPLFSKKNALLML
jgi:hypothetical protein